jgi:hypothetical protein
LQKKQRPRHWDGDVQSEGTLQEFERIKALFDIARPPPQLFSGTAMRN